MLLEGENSTLRALEPQDIDLLYSWENDTELWEVSHTKTPFSKHILQQYLKVAHHDIYTTKQLRLVVQNKSDMPVGFIDLFDFDPYHLRAGVGVFIHKKFENQGYASEALSILKKYAKEVLGLHQLYADVQEKNIQSLALFEKQGFVKIAVKKDWLKIKEGCFENEILLQYLL